MEKVKMFDYKNGIFTIVKLTPTYYEILRRMKAVRGAHWFVNYPKLFKSCKRGFKFPQEKSATCGFRVVKLKR